MVPMRHRPHNTEKLQINLIWQQKPTLLIKYQQADITHYLKMENAYQNEAFLLWEYNNCLKLENKAY